jgi:hypothetical protein
MREKVVVISSMVVDKNALCRVVNNFLWGVVFGVAEFPESSVIFSNNQISLPITATSVVIYQCSSDNYAFLWTLFRICCSRVLE